MYQKRDDNNRSQIIYERLTCTTGKQSNFTHKNLVPIIRKDQKTSHQIMYSKIIRG